MIIYFYKKFENVYIRIGIFSAVGSILLLYSMSLPLTPVCITPACIRAPPKGYLVYNDYCKISDMDPWDSSVNIYFRKKWRPRKCWKTTVTVSSEEKVFRFTRSVSKKTSCCFRELHRVNQDPDNYNQTADWAIRKSVCFPIEKSSTNGTKATSEFLEIECSASDQRTKLDYQAIVMPPNEKSNRTRAKVAFWEAILRQQEQEAETTPSDKIDYDESKIGKNGDIKVKHLIPPSVLIIGIDSISRLHMIRSMPETKPFLESNDFVEMQGYTKIYDNTFPNIMGMLLGQEPFKYSCWQNDSEKFDDCPFIWKKFSEHNYVTAFIEDSAYLAIFNYLKVGFVEQPTDYYMRPMAVTYRKNFENTWECVGGKIETEFILQYENDFIQEMGTKVPYFHLSWFTSIGHQGFNDLQTMDTNFRDLLSRAISIGGQNTVIIFMSDHGYRYGKFRETFLGFYEEALPFFFIRLPPSIKQSHPDWYTNLLYNSHRLTSPLDVHATLEDILSLSSPTFQSNQYFSNDLEQDINENLNDVNDSNNTMDLNLNSTFRFTHGNRQPGFRKIYSMFEEAPKNRTCESSGIPQAYCRCGVHPERAKTNKNSRKFGELIENKINDILSSEFATEYCARAKFNSFLYLRKINDGNTLDNSGQLVTYEDYLVAVQTTPANARFEAKVRLYQNKTMTILGSVSRINSYEGQNDCENNFRLKPYCVCKDYVIKVEKEKELQIANEKEKATKQKKN